MNNIFITGGTGFLAAALIDEILASDEANIHALVRGKDVADATKRLISALNQVNSIAEEKKKNLYVYQGDIAKKDLGLEKETYEKLTDIIDTIYHSAAITDLNLPIDNIRKINVIGTKNILDFALLCKKKGNLRKVNYISTAYVAGTANCTFKEKDLDIGQGFNNTYEQSKFEAEKIVNEYRKKDLDIDIFRPGIILGRHKDGKTTNFKMFYQPLHFFSMELFKKIPASMDSKANIINVDIVAKAIHSIAREHIVGSETYHITSPTVPDFGFVLRIAGEYFGFKVPEFVPREEIDIYKEYSFVQRNMIEPYLPYFNYFTEFNMQNTIDALKSEEFVFPEFTEENLVKLYEYCNKEGFIKRGKKNVSI